VKDDISDSDRCLFARRAIGQPDIKKWISSRNSGDGSGSSWAVQNRTCAQADTSGLNTARRRDNPIAS
jgi:hypothetical protein